ncbi:MAG TPA: FxSxx-COOH system tetratricopeptide repeat protein [Trebonia sp.]
MVDSQAVAAAPAAERYPEVWGQVPQRNKNFTGRDELLAELRTGLAGSVTAVLPHALHGLGGVGKTQVAIEYAYRNMSFYDVVWWIPSDQPELVRSSLAALAPHLQLPPVATTGVQEAASAVLTALRHGEPYSRWLLIFDNADQPEDINDLVPRGPGHCLVTSRNHRWQGIVDTLPVNVFNRDESLDFLTRRVPKAISREAADQLADELGDLPLALEQAGALQAETGMSPQDYLTLLKEHTRELLTESKPSEYPLPMTAAWRISVGKLSDAQPAAMDLLRCCAYFGAEPIPRDIFRRGLQESGSRLNEMLASPIVLARVIRDIARFALATIDPSARTIQVHRLIQALLRDDLSSEEQDMFRHEVHLLLAGGAPADPYDETSWPRFAELVGHITPSEVRRCRDPRVRKFAVNLVIYPYRSADYSSAQRFAERFLRQWRADSGEDHPDVLHLRLLLGNILREQGGYEAANEVVGTALEQARHVLGIDHEISMGLASSHGANLRALGDFAAARELDEESARLAEARLGPSNPSTLSMKHNLALDYGLMGEYAAARELHQSTYVEQSQAQAGVSKVSVLAAWSGLSRAVRLSGDYSAALLLAEDAYEFGRQELGPDSPLTLRSGKELSIAQRVSGDADPELAADLLARYRRRLGEGHPNTLAMANALANTYRVLGRIDEALALATDVVDRYPSVYRADHPYLYGCSANLALLRRLHGDLEAARTLDKSALAGLAKRLGPDHDYALTVAQNLASDLAALGETHAARELGEDTLRRLTAALGADHPVTFSCAANLALDLSADGEAATAGRLSAEAAAGLAGTLGADHHDTSAAGRGERVDTDFDPPPI